MLGDVMKGLVGPRKVEVPDLYTRLINERLPSVEERLPTRYPSRGDRSTYMRVSSLGKLCARRDSIQIVLEKVLQSSGKGEYEMARHIGSAYHGMLQDHVTPRLVGDSILGWWKVLGSPKGDLLSGYDGAGRPKLWRRADAAKHFGVSADELQYVEVEIVNHEYLITGHPDMVIDWSGVDFDGSPDGLEVQEFKTIDPMWWEKTDPRVGGGPDSSYVIQLQSYMWLLGIDRGRLIYFKKGERNPKKGILEFEIELNDGTISAVKDVIASYWEAIVDAHENGTIHEHRLCPRFDRFPATWCGLRHECFGRNRRKAPPYRALTQEEREEWKK